MTTITVHMSGNGFSAARARRVEAAAPAARSHLRLTRRGRLVLSAVVAAPLVALVLWFGLNAGGAGAADHTTPSAPLQHVTVHQGQSLWQIAEAIAPHDDPRDVISAIVDLNSLQTSQLMPGQSLAIPAQYAE